MIRNFYLHLDLLCTDHGEGPLGGPVKVKAEVIGAGGAGGTTRHVGGMASEAPALLLRQDVLAFA